jgi:hypothetical protein
METILLKVCKKIDLMLLNCLLHLILDHNLADNITAKNNTGMLLTVYSLIIKLINVLAVDILGFFLYQQVEIVN